MSNLSFFWLFLIIFISLIIFSLSIFFSLKKQEKKMDFTLSKKKIREIFKKGVRASERTLLPGSKKYDYPWIILLNEGKEDDRIPIESINLMRSRASKNLDVSKSFFWHYFSKGLVLEFSSSALREEDESVKEDIKWTEFLKLCNQYRPRRPIDSIVVSVPAKLLSKSASDKSAKVQLLNLAKAASQRIWMVQNSFSVRVPVYLIISGCEDIPGFESFSKSLPESMRDSILGWSNPNDLSSTFLKEWVVQAINGISETVASLVVDVATSTKKKKNRVSEFLLPIEIKHLQEGLMDYTEALVESSGFYEPFFFRGIYMVTNHEKPSFCKDLFEKKIIGELGLLRPSNNQRFKNSDPNKFLKWIFLSFISIWSIGLVFSAIKGHQIVTRLTEGIAGLNEDAKQRYEASKLGNTLDFDWYRNTAVALIIGLEELDRIRFKGKLNEYGTVFMPGSLPIFDDVFLRANVRVKEGFGELVVNTFRRSLELKTANLTGLPYDTVTGNLVYRDNACKAPATTNGKLSPAEGRSLTLSDSPNFISLENFLVRAKEIERAVLAMNRLRYAGRTSNDDFRYLASFALQADLYGDLSGVTTLFSKTVNRNAEVIDPNIFSKALICSLTEGIISLTDELFAYNSLLEDERKIVEAQEKFLRADYIKLSGEEIINLLNDILLNIKDQEILLAKGGGLWMVQEQLDLGDRYKEFLQEVENNSLLGPDLSSNIELKVTKDFAKLRVNYESLVSERGTEEGIEIGRNEDGKKILTTSEKRKNLQKAIEVLLSDPIMSISTDSQFKIDGDRPFVKWNLDSLDNALTLRESREKYLDKDLMLFPQEYRKRVLESIDSQTEKKLLSLVGRSFNSMGEDSYVIDFDSANKNLYQYINSLSKLKEIIVFMQEMDQINDIKRLKNLILNDASARKDMLQISLDEVKTAFILNDSINFWDENIIKQIESLKEIKDPELVSSMPSFEVYERKVIENLINKSIVFQTLFLLEKAYSETKVEEYIPLFDIQNEDPKKYLETVNLVKEARDIVEDMNHNDETILLDNILVSDAASRLGILTDYFNKKDFFSPSFEKVKNWDGGIDLIESSYSVKSFMGLKESFAFQMVELEKISDLAKAYLYVLPTHFYKKEKNFWGSLQSGVVDYTNNKPGSAIIRLQDFLEILYKNISIENCRDILDKERIDKSANNFISIRHHSIFSEISNRCDHLRRYSIQERWASASTDLERLLLRKKPFANKVYNNISVVDYQALEDASLFEVINTFSKFPRKESVLPLIKKKPLAERINIFYSDLNRLESLFSPYLMKSKEEETGYDIEVQFRGNKDKELYGSRIISWVFYSGESSISLFEENKKLTWNYGDPVKFEMRFAADTNISPYQEKQNPFYRAFGKTSVFNFSGNWSLFDMINMHKITENPETIGEVLKFEFPVQISEEINSKSNTLSNAKVFLKIILKRKSDGKTLAIPSLYPEKIPQL